MIFLLLHMARPPVPGAPPPAGSSLEYSVSSNVRALLHRNVYIFLDISTLCTAIIFSF